MKKHFLLALACAATLPAAQAQTGRIAHLSHGGSVAALRTVTTGLDNFGTPVTMFYVDSVRMLSDSSVVEYGRLYNRLDGSIKQEENKYTYPGHGPDRILATDYVRRLKSREPSVKICNVQVDSVRVLSDTEVVEYVRQRSTHGTALKPQFHYIIGRPSYGSRPGFPAKMYALKTKRSHPEAQVIGYDIPTDSLRLVLPSQALPADPAAKKIKHRRKSSTTIPLHRPAGPLLGVAILLLCGGVGWGLGRRSTATA